MAKTPTLALVLEIVALGSVITCSPFGGGDFTCTQNAQCTGGSGGVCEANGFCSFADPSCAPSGQRYGDGPASGTCVGAQPPIDAPVALVDALVDAPMTTDAAVVDGAVTTDAMPARFCLGTFAPVCVPTAPTAPTTLAATIDTTAGSGACRNDVTDAGGQPLTTFCVVSGSSISGSTVAQGTRPLVLLSATTISITQLDVASHRTGNTLGAAANSSLCVAPGPVGLTGGGGGGGFGSKGGAGGNGAVTGGAGGGTSAATTLRGGCPGGEGSTPNTHGNGGGAVMLLATGTVTIATAINASGSSAATAGGVNGAGASGGGSGGMIVIEAQAIQNNGAVFANGGGGAEGSGGGGNPGADGTDPTGIAAAPGGAGASATGGDGGTGGAKPPSNGDGGKGQNGTAGGGGGGGGGVGVIHTVGGTLTGSVSPTPS